MVRSWQAHEVVATDVHAKNAYILGDRDADKRGKKAVCFTLETHRADKKTTMDPERCQVVHRGGQLGATDFSWAQYTQ